MSDDNRGKSYGQIAYEAGGKFLLANHPLDDLPPGGFEAWAQLDDGHHAYWDEIGRAVSVETYEHHAPPPGVHYTQAYEDLVTTLKAYLETERVDVRKGPAAFAAVLKQAGLL